LQLEYLHLFDRSTPSSRPFLHLSSFLFL
jgi:hypothetical protein